MEVDNKNYSILLTTVCAINQLLMVMGAVGVSKKNIAASIHCIKQTNVKGTPGIRWIMVLPTLPILQVGVLLLPLIHYYNQMHTLLHYQNVSLLPCVVPQRVNKLPVIAISNVCVMPMLVKNY